ncbi:MAG: zinc ribbon domain-containing protein [Ruminococcaceae bacterium]|nr:zinc ribbon domain-containing protein [Oscillospiraceae bacterium]
MAQETVDFLVYETPRGLKKCPACGIEYFDERAFCPECGADIAAVSELRGDSDGYIDLPIKNGGLSEKKKTSKLVTAIKIAGISVAVLFALLLAAIFGIGFGFFF